MSANLDACRRSILESVATNQATQEIEEYDAGTMRLLFDRHMPIRRMPASLRSTGTRTNLESGTDTRPGNLTALARCRQRHRVFSWRRNRVLHKRLGNRDRQRRPTNLLNGRAPELNLGVTGSNPVFDSNAFVTCAPANFIHDCEPQHRRSNDGSYND
jgi:hypothetical protein